MKNVFLKYLLEFLVIFLGILLSFYIDGRVKINAETENKNQLLVQLSEVISEDLKQLQIIDSTLFSVEKSLNYLIDDLINKPKASSKELALNHLNVSRRMSLSFFPNSGIYKQILSDGAMKLIEAKELRSKISLIYEHNSKRSQAVSRSLDDFNELFNGYFYPYIQTRAANEKSKTIYANTKLIYHNISPEYYKATSAFGYYYGASNFVSNYRSLLGVFKEEYKNVLQLIEIELNQS
tara:strand:- start:172 stop:882 length:711 start_codon:yes stop_codon:yes gene_type:complete